MNFEELKSTRNELWPEGESENLIAVHNRYFINALYDLQKNVVCLQANNNDVFRQCSTYFNCGMTVLPAPRGHIMSVSVIDKIDPYTGLESADAEDDWCKRIYYQQVDYCHLQRYAQFCARCSNTNGTTLSSLMTTLFGPFRIKRSYPRPTDEGLESQPPLPEGYHYPQESTDAEGRSPSGVFALHNGRIYVAPWIQSTETLVIQWNGIKRNFSDADLVDDDPKFVQAVMTHVKQQHELHFGKKEDAQALHVELWGTPATTGSVGLIPDLIHECMEENRKRSCDEALGSGPGGGGARGMAPTSTTTGGGSLFYNERQSYTASCPNGQTGDSVTVIKEAGTYHSALSVADANAQAISAAQQEANSRLACEDSSFAFYNTPQTYTANCPVATDGDDTPTADGNPVTVTIPAGAYASNVSQAAADDAALAAAQASAEAQLACTFWNASQTYTAECPDGSTGSDVEKTVAARSFSSTISQEDANSKALAEAQNLAQAELSCSGTTFVVGNTPQSVQVQYPCPTCHRSPIIFAGSTVAANTFTATANAATQADILYALNQQARTLAQQRANAGAQLLCQQCSFLIQ